MRIDVHGTFSWRVGHTGAAPYTIATNARLSFFGVPFRRPHPGLVAPLVAPPAAHPPGPLRHARAAGGRAAVPGCHRVRLRLPAAGGDGPRTRGRQARRRIRAAAHAPAPAGAA